MNAVTTSLFSGITATEVLVAIAFLTLLFSIFRYVSRKRARLIYYVFEFSRYGIPDKFLTHAPVAISIENSGTKAAENTVLRVTTKSDIAACQIEPSSFVPTRNDREILVNFGLLNPKQEVKVFINCKGSPLADQVERLELTHSEGEAERWPGQSPSAWINFATQSLLFLVVVVGTYSFLRFVSREGQSRGAQQEIIGQLAKNLEITAQQVNTLSHQVGELSQQVTKLTQFVAQQNAEGIGRLRGTLKSTNGKPKGR
jgi:hypothetical protein